MSKLFLATNNQGKVFALKNGNVVGRVYKNTDSDIQLSEHEFYRVYEGWSDVVQLSNNPPNPFYNRPSEVFSNWDLPLGTHAGISLAISSKENDLLPYTYGEKFRG